MMFRFLVRRSTPAFLLISAAFAQDPTELFRKAPPDVDEALRARIAKFYQAHVDGKPRRAEEIVAEESKDFYYDMKKPKYLSFEISRIAYSDNFTKAIATVMVETVLPLMGFADKPMKVPLASNWKLVDGEWYWHIDPDTINMTPFGKMGVPPANSGAPNAGPATPGAAVSPLSGMGKGPDAKALWSQVKADKSAVQLKATEPSADQVTILNRMPGNVKLELRTGPVPGLEIKLDPAEIQAGEKATVTFRFVPGKTPLRGPLVVYLAVQPTNQLIPIRVLFK